jgi:hypothetical protein
MHLKIGSVCRRYRIVAFLRTFEGGVSSLSPGAPRLPFFFLGGHVRDCYETLRMDSDPPLALLTPWLVFTDEAVDIGAIPSENP